MIDQLTLPLGVDSQGPAVSGGFVTFFARQNLVENGCYKARFFTKNMLKHVDDEGEKGKIDQQWIWLIWWSKQHCYTRSLTCFLVANDGRWCHRATMVWSTVRGWGQLWLPLLWKPRWSDARAIFHERKTNHSGKGNTRTYLTCKLSKLSKLT